MLLLTHLAATPRHVVTTSSGPFSSQVYIGLIAALVLWIVVYFLYKVLMTSRKDFGLPVRRRLLCRGLRVDGDQSADAPFWWTDLQIQRAVSRHWRQTLRAPLGQGSEAAPNL